MSNQNSEISSSYDAGLINTHSLKAIVPPANGVYSEGSTLDFQLIYNKVTIVTGSPCFLLAIGLNNRPICYTEGSGSNVIIFSYTITATDNDLNGVELYSSITLGPGESINQKNGPPANTLLSPFLNNLSSILVNTSVAAPDQVALINQIDLSPDKTEATFTWAVPNNNGNAITKYLVRYREKGTTLYKYITPEPTNNFVTISDLTLDIDYEVQVAAFSTVIGSYSPIFEFSTKFNPASLGALIWYEARDINNTGIPPIDGTLISNLIDKSGNNNNATLVSGVSASIETENGKKVLRLTNSGFKTINSLGEAANTDLEIYVIAKTRTVSKSCAFSNENHGNTNRLGTHFPWTDGLAYIDTPLADRFSIPWGGNTTDFFAWTFRSSTTQGRALERNGNNIANLTNRSNSPPLKRWAIGKCYNNTNPWKADIQSFFVFDKILDPIQRSDFFDYIERNFGVIMSL